MLALPRIPLLADPYPHHAAPLPYLAGGKVSADFRSLGCAFAGSGQVPRYPRNQCLERREKEVTFLWEQKMRWARVIGEGGAGSGRLEIERDTPTACSVTVPSAAVGAAVGRCWRFHWLWLRHTAYIFDSFLTVTGNR